MKIILTNEQDIRTVSFLWKKFGAKVVLDAAKKTNHEEVLPSLLCRSLGADPPREDPTPYVPARLPPSPSPDPPASRDSAKLYLNQIRDKIGIHKLRKQKIET